MTRTILIYGVTSGVVVILGIIATILLDYPSALLGYLIMLVALSSILVAVKQHRDQALGGVIRFLPAFAMGLAIAVVASIAYVVVWEGYLAATGYRFMDQLVDQTLAAKRAAGVTGEAYARAAAKLETMRRNYANPMLRVGMTFMEIFPVGLVVSLVSAALLRNPRFLPARSPPIPV